MNLVLTEISWQRFKTPELEKKVVICTSKLTSCQNEDKCYRKKFLIHLIFKELYLPKTNKNSERTITQQFEIHLTKENI